MSDGAHHDSLLSENTIAKPDIPSNNHSGDMSFTVPTEPSGVEQSPDQSPKRGFTGATIMVVMLLLLIALPVAVYYVSQSESLNDIRNRAALSCFDSCHKEKGTKVCNTKCGTNVVVTPKPKPGEEEVTGCGAGSFPCAACGGFCVTGKSKTCNQVAAVRCPEEPVQLGIVKCVKSGTTWVADPSMNYSNATGPGAIGVVNGESVWTQVNTQCGRQMTDGGFANGTEKYLCKVGVKGYTQGSCTANNGVPFTGNLGCFCGVVQVDTASGHQSFSSTCGCASETTTTSTSTNTPVPTDTNTPTPTNTLTQTPTHTSSPTPTNTPTATPTTAVTCNSECTVNTDCTSDLVCSEGRCRNAQCTDRSTCQCVVVTNTPTPTPKPVAFVGCNSACTINTDCSSGLVCIDSFCRNPSCSDKTTCACDVVQATPKTPIAGSGPSVLGASVIAGGFLLVLLGLAL